MCCKRLKKYWKYWGFDALNQTYRKVYLMSCIEKKIDYGGVDYCIPHRYRLLQKTCSSYPLEVLTQPVDGHQQELSSWFWKSC